MSCTEVVVELNNIYRIHGSDYFQQLADAVRVPAKEGQLKTFPAPARGSFALRDLSLIREPTNRYDPNAIKVCIGKRTLLCYVSKETNKRLKNYSDSDLENLRVVSLEPSPHNEYCFSIRLLSNERECAWESEEDVDDVIMYVSDPIKQPEQPEQPKSPKKETKMKLNTNNLKNMFFREINNVAIDMMTGSLGFVKDGNVNTFANGAVNVNPITDMAVTIPAFAMLTKITDLKQGDIVVFGDALGFFVSSNEAQVVVVGANGNTVTITPTNNLLFGGAGSVMAVRNMFGNMSSGDANGMNPMLAFALMGDGGEKGDMLKTMMFMQMMGGGNMGGMNPLMLLALAK